MKINKFKFKKKILTQDRIREIEVQSINNNIIWFC